MDNTRLQAEINRWVATRVPRLGWSTTVAIVIANRPSVHLLGTGSLFEVGGCHFVVTAAHVVAAAHALDKTIGISDSTDSFVSVHGNWIRSADTQGGGIADPFDIAIYKLPTEALPTLQGKHFLRREEIDFHEQSKTAVFSLFGFPGIWAKSSGSDDEPVSVKALEYTTYAYDGATESLLGYQSRYHLLLDSNPSYLTQLDGSPTAFLKPDGRSATMPRDLKGISGCAVWSVGDLKLPLEQWCERDPKVVGVETGIYQDSQLVRTTRWVAVTTLIHEAFPELRPALQIWTPDS